MNENQQHCSETQPGFQQTEAALPPVPTHTAFFGKTDWWSFGITTVLVLSVYLFTLAPEVDLEFSGIFAAGAMYPGVPHPPGYPLWTIYAWLFIKLLPFANTAWRVSVSSALAGALASGVIALMVSRGGALLLQEIARLKRINEKEEHWLSAASGAVVGMGFGFQDTFWRYAVVGEATPFSLLLFALALCMLMKWFYL